MICLIIESIQVLSFKSLNRNFEIDLRPDLELDNKCSIIELNNESKTFLDIHVEGIVY